jgi:ribose transport system permease protein
MPMSSMLVAVLNVIYEIGVGWAVIAALALGIAVDLINGLLITVLRIHSLIVALGTGTFLHGATLRLSDSDDDQRNFALSHECGPRRSALRRPSRVLLRDRPRRSCLVPARIYRGRPAHSFCRSWTRSGAAQRHQHRSHSRRLPCRFGAWVGVLYAGTQGAADPVSGVSYQLSALAAAFLGSTCIARGRFNPWGATVAVYFLVTGIAGLVFLGFSSFIQEMFYGGALVIAVTLSQLVRGRQEQQF